MMKKNPFQKSVLYAFQGLRTIANSERNFRIHLLATLAVLTIAFIAGCSIMEWFMLLTAIALVLIIECINTALEYMCDKVEPQYSPIIKKIKDISAGAVLLASAYAVLIALLVLLL